MSYHEPSKLLYRCLKRQTGAIEQKTGGKGEPCHYLWVPMVDSQRLLCKPQLEVRSAQFSTYSSKISLELEIKERRILSVFSHSTLA